MLSESESSQKSESAAASTQEENNKLAEALAAVSKGQNDITEVVLIDPSVPDYETLMAGISDQAQIHILSSSASLAEIADVLSGYQNLDAVHIISHGDIGSLALSGELITSDSLASQQEKLAAIGQSLNQDGDILLYGCNVGSEGDGQAFIDQLAELTGADIAASDDLTGSEALGGDWQLEVNAGYVTQASLEFADYQNILPNTIGFDDFSLGGSDLDNPSVHYTEAGVTITIATVSGQVDILKHINGSSPLSGAYLEIYDDDPGSGENDEVITFDSEINLTSIVLGSALDDYAITLTPTGGSNSPVTTPVILGSDGFDVGTPITVLLNWVGVTGFTITGANYGVYLDSFVLADSNSAPTISIDNTTLPYTENDSPVQIDSAATMNDPDGNADWYGGTLKAQITSNNEAADRLSISDSDGDGTAITVSGTNLLAGSTTIGTLSASGGEVTNG